MTQKIKHKVQLAIDIKLILIFIFLSIIFVIVPPFNQTPLRIPIILLFLLFIPGYSFISLFFPRKNDLTGIERVTLSIVLSIAIVIFDGFALNSSPWGFRPAPIIISLSIITLILLIFTHIFRKNIPKFDYYIFPKSLISDKSTAIEKVLVIMLVVGIIIASVIIIWTKLTFPEEKFTAFYILGNEGKAENYTTDLFLGRSTSILVGIENHEHQMVNYTLETKMGRTILNENKITLDHGGKWMGNISFVVNKISPRMKLEFFLYKDEGINPDKSLHLWAHSHIDDKNLEILNNYQMSKLPDIKNGDMKLASDWVFNSNNKFIKGIFLNSTNPESENSIIKGYVIDSKTGLPISNASVKISNHYGYEKLSLTNNKGYYELRTIPDHLWLEAWTQDYKEKSSEFNTTNIHLIIFNISLDTLPFFKVTTEGEWPSKQVKLEKLPSDKISILIPTLQGYVTDSITDLPISNASIMITNFRGFEENVTTNERGYFKIMAIPEYLRMEAKAEGYMQNVTSFNVSMMQIVYFELTPESSTINGYIFDKKGNPIVNATIRVGDHSELNKQTYYKETKSISTGYYEINSIAGHMWLYVSKNDYLSDDVEIDIGYPENKEIDFRLDPKPLGTAKVSGYIIDSNNGEMLEGVKVVISDQKYYKKSTLTNSRGYYEIYTVPGKLWLDVNSNVYMKSKELTLTDAQTHSVNIMLDASPVDVYKIICPSETHSELGYYGGIYQDIESEEGIIILSFKVKDSWRYNNLVGYNFKQVLLNDIVIWEDDIAGDEEWQQVKIPISLESGKNRIMLRTYEKQSVSNFGVYVLWDDVRIEPFSLTTYIINDSSNENIKSSNGMNQLDEYHQTENKVDYQYLAIEQPDNQNILYQFPPNTGKIFVISILILFAILWININRSKDQ